MALTAEPGQPETDTSGLGYCVGVGASAGGLEALESFFASLPADSGMAFVVIQHLSPDYKSMMVELLSKRTAMKVLRAEDGMQVEPDHVYVITPRKNLTIFHGRLVLTDTDPARGVNLPIDIFLRSLADDQGERAIAVILSGTGSDGVRGVRAVKEAGGMVMVQDPASARFDGMPRAAAATGFADFVLPPDEMPARLVAFCQRRGAVLVEGPPALLSDEDGMARLFALLRERSRVDFTLYKPTTVVRRIERRMAVNQIHDLRDYVRYMQDHAGEVSALYRELLIGVTSFFRDREVFDELERVVLPALLAGREDRELRLWVAGCSTGEEAYSLAIIVRETLESLGANLDVRIFATDIDRDAVAQAGAGLFPESVAGDLSARLLSTYFRRRDDYYQIDRSIREMVVFAQHNLVTDPPFTNIDLVSCRNLLIYLQPVLQQRVLELFSFSLNPGGVLLLGSSETVGDLADAYEVIHHRYKLFRSKGRRRPGPDGANLGTPAEPRGWQQRLRRAAVGRPLRPSEEERTLDRLLQALSPDYVPVVVVVNPQMEVVHIAGDPAPYFRLASGKALNDVVRMAVPELAMPLTTGLQRVFASGTEVCYTHIHVAGVGEDQATVRVRIRALPSRRGQEALAAVIVEGMAPAAAVRAEEVGVYDVGAETQQRLQDLEQELQFTRENLQATIEELETTNEELQASNEELLASNEELQSTNEELHSVNEELHTVNAEHQRKIIELTELTNDLDNLLGSTRIGTLFLDENLEVRRFTPEIQRVLSVFEADLGRPVHHLRHSLVGIDLFLLARDVVRGDHSVEREVQGADGGWYLLRVLPYRVRSGAVSGVVVVLVDISSAKATERALSDTEQRLASLFRVAPVGIGLLIGQVVAEVSDRVCTMTGYDRADLVNQSALRLYATPDEHRRVCRVLADQVTRRGIGTVETAWRRRDGSLVPVLLSVTPLADSHIDGELTFTVLDLSPNEEAALQAQESQARFRLLFQTMSEGVVFQGADGAITDANPAAETLLGLSVDQLLGRTSVDPRWRAIRPDGADFPGVEHPSMVALRTGRPVNGVVMGICHPFTGQTRWLRVNATPLYTAGGTAPTQVYTTFAEATTEAVGVAGGRGDDDRG